MVSVFNLTQNLEDLGTNPDTPTMLLRFQMRHGLDCVLVTREVIFLWSVGRIVQAQASNSTLNTILMLTLNDFPGYLTIIMISKKEKSCSSLVN